MNSPLTKAQPRIAIIGAGPAGLAASLTLSRAGVPHYLIEAKCMPRHKACADIITSKAIRSINALLPGVIDAMVDAQEAMPIWGTMVYTDAEQLDVPYKSLEPDTELPSCYSVSRYDLDLRLWDEIAAKGVATMMAECRLQEVSTTDTGHRLSLSNGESIETDLIMIGTGSSSALVDRLFENEKSDRHEAVGIRAYYEGIDVPRLDRCELYLLGHLSPGGFYIAPMCGGRFNVNVVVRKDKLKRAEMNLRSVMDDCIAGHETLRERFATARRISEPSGGGLKLGTKRRSIIADGLMLIGDSAGLIDLLSGNGIPQALISGQLAAEAAMCAQASADYSKRALSGYPKALELRIKGDLALGRFLSPMLSYPWFNDSMHGLLNKMSSSNTLQRLVYSDRPVKELLRSVVGHSPKSLAQE